MTIASLLLQFGVQLAPSESLITIQSTMQLTFKLRLIAAIAALLFILAQPVLAGCKPSTVDVDQDPPGKTGVLPIFGGPESCSFA
ncbi:hypothetical protein D9758_015726 [Tetrapyrgos nigripes]|uniref:Uncharacterized protein n=1 Tax=Tetrapyrgos nigripes TaxID=182062 RepID=A0A8H5CS08_9AGAR|nr:hypothetical protein D9758_015726 [Tetrapyrgos nigripes]